MISRPIKHKFWEILRKRWSKHKTKIIKKSRTQTKTTILPCFRSLGGLLFTSFAKYTSFGKDLYADLVSPSLQANIMVETWPNGPGKMSSSCRGPFQVENIDEIDFGKVAAGVDFTTKHDHSKWAVSYPSSPSRHSRLNNNVNYVCIGDINRMETQKKRGGGTVCFQSKFAWKAFTGIVKAVESCPV